MMIGLMDACKLSVFGLNELAENATGSDTGNLNETLRLLEQGELNSNINRNFHRNLLPIVSISVFKLSNLPNFELLLGDLKI